ncbi:MAG TPA: hypothetical protein DCR93_23665 [Cytophagales bacterium]|nr:hypothetical protein [Cytophagales bacterium]HAP62365.1 hypothetical protein [Cytophagales bacterium]
MADWLSVLLLVGMGIILLLIELLFVPGTTVVGILGFILSAIGVYLSYVYFGNSTGSLVLLGTLALSVGTAIYSFRSGVWDRFANKSKVEGRVNSDPLTIGPGDVGETTSALRPIGKAEFGNKLYEVRTLGNYVEARQKVKVTHIDHTKIFVEPLTE